MIFFFSSIRYTIQCSGLLLLLLLLNAIPLHSQVAGCTDPLANNYNALATVNNGSCTYNTTSYTPAAKVNPLADLLVENSGLQWAGNALWSFNDGGGDAAIYKLDTISKAILQSVYLEGATNVDWEDIGFDGAYFYVGDFGNNANGARTDLKIYKFAFASIPDHATNPVVTIPANAISIIQFSYSDQQQPPVPVSANSTQFDCEAMIIDQGKIHLFTKNWVDLSTTHYVVDGLAGGTYAALPVETLPAGFLVTAADKAVGNNVIALLGYQITGSANHFMILLSGYSNGQYFNGNKRRIDLPDAGIMGQAEGLCFKNAFTGYISNEKLVVNFGGFPFTISQKLRTFDIRSLVSGLQQAFMFWGSGNWSDVANWTEGQLPPSSPAGSIKIIIDPLAGGSCVVNVPVTVYAGTQMVLQPGKHMQLPQGLSMH